MDPLSIQMAMGSPPMLRGKISFSSLVGRKKRFSDGDKSADPLQTLETIGEDIFSTPRRRGTVRTRRGFRPLSVFTNSLLTPFESETLKAMAELRCEGGDDDEAAGGAAQANEDEVETLSVQSSEHAVPQTSKSAASVPFSSESELSLRAFLAQPATEGRTQEDLNSDLSTLQHLSPPDLSQHPAFQHDPFTSSSDTPKLTTSSSAKNIKKVKAQARSSSSFTDRTSTSPDIAGGTSGKKRSFFDPFRISSSPVDQESAVSTETSPLAKHQQKFCPIEVPCTTPEASSSAVDRKVFPGGGIRKLSELFKTKPGQENSAPSPEETSNESPEEARKRIEQYLRKVTCSPSYPYSDCSWLPRHPNTGRFWRSRNLKCTNCSDVSCSCCGRTCCAYKAAVMAVDTHSDNPEGRQAALERIQQITMVYPYGRELPTFLQCTSEEGDAPGCGKIVCPDCCGVCPDPICGDIQCRKCKEYPWTECDWHADTTPSQHSSVSREMTSEQNNS